MDSDLAEAVSALKEAFEKRKIPVRFGKADAAVLDNLKKALKVPARYRSLLAEADPEDVETVTPVERVRFIPAGRLVEEQRGQEGAEGAPEQNAGWRKSWVVIARSAYGSTAKTITTCTTTSTPSPSMAVKCHQRAR